MTHFDISQIDPVIHGKIRLGLMSYLSGMKDASFNELKALLKTSDGNLSVQIKKLEDKHFVMVQKTFINRKAHTRVSLTQEGRKAWGLYLEHLQHIINGGAQG